MKTSLVRILAGLLVVLVGVAFLFSNLDVFSIGDILRHWWPMLIVATGLLIGLADFRKNYLWSLLIVGFGVIWQLQQLEIIAVNPWQLFWPAVIVVIGISIILTRENTKVPRAASISAAQGVTAILSGADVKIADKQFEGTRAVAILGGAVLDLRKATITNKAIVEVTCMLGGIEIRVPKDVIVKSETLNIAAGTEDTSDRDVRSDAPTLIVTGNVFLGGVEIKN